MPEQRVTIAQRGGVSFQAGYNAGYSKGHEDGYNAAKAEPPRDWTPCAEGLPTQTDKYWVTVFYYGALFVEDRDYFAHEKYWGQGLKPVAWMPKFKPEPYRADDTTGKVKEDKENG